MYVKTFLCAAASLAALPMQAQPEHRAQAHCLIEGQVRTTEGHPLEEAIYFDVYELMPDGQRVLMRTGREKGQAFRCYLRLGFDHEVVVQVHPFPPVSQTIKASALAKGALAEPLVLKIVLPPACSDQDLPPADNYGEELDVASSQGSGKSLPRAASDKGTGSSNQTDSRQYRGGASLLPEIASLPPVPRRAASPKPLDIVEGLRGQSLHRVLLQLPAGQAIDILEYTTADWWMVGHGNLIGWAKAEHFR